MPVHGDSTPGPDRSEEAIASDAKRAGEVTREEAPPADERPVPQLAEDEIVVVAARGMALFPGVVLPIVIGRARSVRAVQAAIQIQSPIGVLLQRDSDVEVPKPEELYRVGTVADVVRYITTPDGSHHVITQGRERFRVLSFTRTDPYLVARIERIPEPADDVVQSKEIQARFLSLKQRAHEALELLPEKPEELDAAVDHATSPSMLADMVATFMDIPPEEKQEILETIDLAERLDKVLKRLADLSEVLSLSNQIREETQGSMTKAQRDYYLREQLRTIQRELGESESEDLKDLAKTIEECGMPEEVLAEARKELRRLERMPEAAAEHSMVRTYLDWLVELPWARSSEDVIDLDRAREILDADHYGLEKVKRRILEFLAVRKLKADGKGPILCLVGPPGVGKTSLGQSIARAMGREFVRLSLGGVHDEAEIRGHRRTYVGSMPGSIVQSIKKAGTNNPIFMLDEMDKLSPSFHGDPSAALLEVLDPEQNKHFVDHYLGVPFDLSRCMFIGTANVLDGIPGPLRDRCEVIELSGYTEAEKLEIAKRYLVARQLEANGLDSSSCRISDDALRTIIRDYTREAGCRNLEREIGAAMRHAATRIARGEVESVMLDDGDLHEILGPPRFESELKLRTSLPGVATGLAWTPVGGNILFIEATAMPGEGKFILTGQLGDVMKESAQAAISLVKANAVALGVGPERFEHTDLHVHIPAGAIPKDGPSAGITMFVALVSLLTGRQVHSDVAMTGEISLRGLVLPVGGIKEKVLAAYTAGIGRVLLPARNEKDLVDVPPEIRDNLDVVLLKDVHGALDAALEEAPTPAKTGAR